MPLEKENTYQYPEIIIEKMVKKSGLTQNKFAEDILGIRGVNLSRAKKSGKIPDKWFELVKEKLGITKEELCETLQEKLIRSNKGTLTKSVGIGWRNEQPPTATEETAPIQDQLRRYDPLMIKFRHLFDFILDTYGDNQVAIDDFAERLRQLLITDRDYNGWVDEKRTEMEETLKKRACGSLASGPQKKVSNED